MSSYKLHGPWKVDRTYEVGMTPVVIALEVTDLIDNRGRVFDEGAWRVKVDGKVRKTFKGETAWSDAQRLYNDEIVAARWATY
jgi:hypothetical protein